MRRTDLFRIAVLAAGLVLAASSTAYAQGGGSNLLPGASAQQRPGGGVTTCSARNALGTKQCTSTCPAGQSADCDDGDAGSDPVCTCSGG